MAIAVRLPSVATANLLLKEKAMVTGRHVREDTLKVWDVPLRLFHWLLVVAIAIAFLSSEGDSPIAGWHIAAGWTVVVLVVFRLVWGSIGGEHARFDATAFGPRLEAEHGMRHGGDRPFSAVAEGTDKD
ncbi:cytochrome b/b6 domain-containing protein [Sphingomonas sp. MMS24-J13]|uniref:cytochrome b/b6 domain-containing protein n=1 Tax=Sphingomonas sp. MMS24-J13 TaxID=3238686 RepID=UPI00384BDA42